MSTCCSCAYTSYCIAFLVVYFFPSVVKQSKYGVINLFRLPGIGIRALLCSFTFFFSLICGLIALPFLKSHADMNKFIGYINMPICCFLFGVTYNIQNYHLLRTFDHGIILMNHQSFFDAPFVSGIFRHFDRPVVGVAKAGLRKWPILGWYWGVTGGIFVENSGTKTVTDTQKSIDLMKAVSKRIKDEKITVAIFPEGHRNSEPKLLELKKGGFHMAQDAGVPVLPIVIATYMDKVWSCNFPWNPRMIQIEILKPTETASMTTKEEVNKLTIDTEREMAQTLERLNKIEC
jgi:1-acyl-sn-glycerol-3-phosphate acyltransferase